MSTRFDIVVIGSGPGGYRAAVLAGLQGKKVAIIEKHIWGGCCLNRGCVPKKTWYHTAKTISQSKNYNERGIHGALWADLQTAWRHQQAVVDTVRDSYLNYMKRLGVKRIEGVGSIADPNTVSVITQKGETHRYSTSAIIIATGATTRIPEGFSETPDKIITTDNLFEQPPPHGDRVGIIGSGVIGSEFAYIFSQFNLKVTWFGTSPPINRSNFSEQTKDYLRKLLKDGGLAPTIVKGRLNAEVEGHHVAVKQNVKTLAEVDWVLLAMGRTPCTAELGLTELGITTDANGFIQRNAYLQTSVENIYAIGDCANPAMTANHALAEATTAVSNIIQSTKVEHDASWVPQVIYSSVEIARVGLTEDEAEDAGYDPAVGFAAFETSPAALGQDDSNGFVRLVADSDEHTLLGAEIAGEHAAELAQNLIPQRGMQVSLKSLVQRPYNHPARAEEILNAAETMAAKWKLDDVFSP